MTSATPVSAAHRRFPSPKPLARLWPRVRPHFPKLLLATLLLTASAAITLIFPLVIGELLDAAFIAGGRAALDREALGLIGLFLIQAVLNYGQVYLLSAAGERAIAGLREEVFGRLLEMPPGFFAERRTGELVSRLTSDIGLLQGILSNQVAEFARQCMGLIGAVVILTLKQPQLTLTALAVMPVVVGTIMLFGRRLRRISTGVQDRFADATAVAEEAFGQIRTVQSFVQEPAERARYHDRMAGAVAAALSRAHVRGLFFGAITLSAFSGMVIVLRQGGLLVLEGKLTPGSLVAFLVYTITIAGAIGALATLIGGYQESVGAAERVFQILEAPIAVQDPPNPIPLPRPLQGRVSLEGVSFRYHESAETPWALREVTLSLAPGEVVALVGPSGGGKTTLVSLLSRFWDVTEGRILLDGIDLRSLRLAELRGAIGIVPQEPALFSGSIASNIAYGRPEASPADVEAAAKAAHAHEFIERLPEGYGTIVGERGVKLSGGQRQRVAIARAILKDPAVLVLDEATSSLDTESERLVEDALEKLMLGRSTLIIAHRLSTVRRAHRLVVLDRGRIVEQGTHSELLALSGLYARLYQKQFRDEDDLQSKAITGLTPTPA